MGKKHKKHKSKKHLEVEESVEEGILRLFPFQPTFHFGTYNATTSAICYIDNKSKCLSDVLSGKNKYRFDNHRVEQYLFIIL